MESFKFTPQKKPDTKNQNENQRERPFSKGVLLQKLQDRFPTFKTIALSALFSAGVGTAGAENLDKYTAEKSVTDAEKFNTEMGAVSSEIHARKEDIVKINPFFIEGYGDEMEDEINSEGDNALEEGSENMHFSNMNDAELFSGFNEILESGSEIFENDAPLETVFIETDSASRAIENDPLPTFHKEDLGRMFQKDSKDFFKASHKSGYSMSESDWSKLCKKYPSMTLGEYLVQNGISGVGVLNELSEHVLLMDIGKSLKEYRKKAISAESGTAIEDREVVVDEEGHLYLKLCRNRIRLVEIETPPLPVRVVKVVEPAPLAVVIPEKVVGNPHLKYTQERMFQSVRCADGVLHFTYTARYMIPKGYMPKNPDGTVDTSVPVVQKDTLMVHFFEDQVLINPKTNRPFDCATETIICRMPSLSAQYCMQMYEPRYIQENYFPQQNGRYIPRKPYAVWSPKPIGNPESTQQFPQQTGPQPKPIGSPVFQMYSEQTLPKTIFNYLQENPPTTGQIQAMPKGIGN